MATQKINLTLPRNWNQCTIEQLELIANVLREQVERQDRYHPFSMQNVKIALFFALTGIEILEGPNPRVPVEEQYYKTLTPALSRKGRGSKMLYWLKRLVGKAPKREVFSLYLWQINYWINGSPLDNKGNLKSPSPSGRARGGALLDWLNNDNNDFLTRFPYDIVKRSSRSRWFSIGCKVSFQGPQKDLDGFSWSQYRLATESMQNYVQLSNSLAKMQQMNRGNYSPALTGGGQGGGSRSFSDEQMQKQAQNVDMAKSLFLATIFNRKVKYIETSTGIIRKDYHYESNQITDNAEYFRSFPDTQWQVILFWWTGIMHTLQKRYPHVFKVQKVSKKQLPSSAMEIYSATIATMQKYVGINEQDCNNQSYSLVLEQLERMAKENEELERIRKKK